MDVVMDMIRHSASDMFHFPSNRGCDHTTTEVAPATNRSVSTLGVPTYSDSILGQSLHHLPRSSRAVSGWSLRSQDSMAASLNKAWKLLNQSSLQICFSYAKMVFASMLPLTVICVLCSLALTNDVRGKSAADSKRQYIAAGTRYASLASSLAKERGMTCTMLSAATVESKATVLGTVNQYRGNTDAALLNFSSWAGTEDDGEEFKTVSTFQRALQQFRSKIDAEKVQCSEVLEWYTNRTNKLIDIMTRGFQQTAEGEFWSTVLGYSDLLIARDTYGLVRALGSSFYLTGGFNDANFTRFFEYWGTASTFMTMLQLKSESAKRTYADVLQSNGSLIAAIDDFIGEIQNNSQTGNGSLYRSQMFFDNATAFQTITDYLAADVVGSILEYLDLSTAQSRSSLVSTIAIVVVIGILCPPIMIWYAVNNHKLMTNMQDYVQLVFAKTEELDKEKKRTDMILNQILPPSIVADLKRNKKILPETYESVTIYFSDVKGFTALSSHSTPIEIIDLLNELYTSFDSILDRYDVYKVETIGDAYMVVSGVPRRNGEKHSAEIATVALDILRMMDEFYIPHLPTEKLLIRIGVHTGPCAAGVVGIKMPRYCLFGDTVTTSSKMESTGNLHVSASKIQLSTATHQALQKHGDTFDMVSRGMMEIPGKGEMETFWLLGKRDFPFRVNLERADRELEKYRYWSR